MKVQTDIHQAASGRVRCLVVDGKTKQVKHDYGWFKIHAIGYLT